MKLTFILAILILTTAVQGQIEHLARYELEHDWDNLDYVVISNLEKGALVVQPQVKGMTDEYPVVFHHLNRDLEFQWADTLAVSRRMQLRGYHYVDNKNILLFQNTQFKRRIKIVVIDTKEKDLQQFEPKNIVDLEITEFEVIKDHVIIGGYIQERPAVFAYDLKTDKVKTLSNVFQNRSELLEVKINSDSLTFNVLSSIETETRDRTIAVNTYDFAGNAIRNYQLVTEKEHQLLTGVSSSILDKEQVVVGLYCVRAGTFPSGLFVNHVDRTGIQTMKYYTFGEFDTFLEHEGVRRAGKLREKALDFKDSKRVWRYKTDVLFDEMKEAEVGLMVLGEFFKPWSMNTQNYMKQKFGLSDFNDFNDPIRNNREFYGFSPLVRSGRNQRGDIDFTHAFALKLDPKGNILWDDSMIIDEDLESPLRNFGAFQWSGTSARYAYYLDQEIVAQPFISDTTSRMIEEIKLMEEDEKVTYDNEEFQGIVGWYDNHFLVFGVHSVKSDESGRRKVFFLNAITVK